MEMLAETGREISRREKAKEGRRTRIVKATYALLREVGMDELSVKLIAQRADVSPATVYNLFGTKSAVLEKVNEVNLREFEALVAKAPSIDALDRIFDATEMAADTYDADPAFYRSLMYVRDTEGADQAEKVKSRQRENFWTIMSREAQAEGHLVPTANVQLIGMAMTQLATGVFSQWGYELITARQLAAETSYGFAALLTPFAAPAALKRLHARLSTLETDMERLEAERIGGAAE